MIHFKRPANCNCEHTQASASCRPLHWEKSGESRRVFVHAGLGRSAICTYARVTCPTARKDRPGPGPPAPDPAPFPSTPPWTTPPAPGPASRTICLKRSAACFSVMEACPSMRSNTSPPAHARKRRAGAGGGGGEGRRRAWGVWANTGGGGAGLPKWGRDRREHCGGAGAGWGCSAPPRARADRRGMRWASHVCVCLCCHMVMAGWQLI